MRNRIVVIGLAAAGVSAFLCVGARIARAAEAKEEVFMKMDTNGDGKISVEEWTTAHKDIYAKMDANGDGKVTPDEMKAGIEKQHGQMMGKPGAEEMVTEKIKMMDTNGDGYISEEEFIAGSKTAFDKMDANHDGYLTKSEMKAAHEKMKGKMQEKSQEKSQQQKMQNQ
jgi:Ca2+-binding EF-hand superfamily protein